MNKTECLRLEEELLSTYAALSWLPLRLEAVSHTLHVLDMISVLDTDTSLWDRRACAVLHDYGRYVKNSPHHARISAEEASRRYPEETNLADAIRCHSRKDRIDSPLAEDLKDADVLARWLEDPEGYRHPRLQNALKRIGRSSQTPENRMAPKQV